MKDFKQNELNALWDNLKTTVDRQGYKQSLNDPKVEQKSNTIYIEEQDPFAFDFYKKDAASHANDIDVKTITTTPDENTVKAHKNAPGLVSSVLINDEKGVRATPYIYLGGAFTELDVSASYFNVLGLLKSGRINEAKQIAGNITYMIGHTYSLKATNRIYHQHVRALPVYTAMVREIAEAIPKAERPAYLKAHTTRAILDYNRNWHELESQVIDGLNIYPKTKVDNASLSFTIPSAEIIPVRLNMMLYKTEKDIAYFLKTYMEGGHVTIDDETHTASKWEDKAAQRLKAMQQKLWNASLHTFNDFNIETKQHVNLNHADFIYALWAGAFNDAHLKHVESLVSKHQNTHGFKYDLNGKSLQAPEQIIAWLGLENYGSDAAADTLRSNWQNMVLKNYNANNELALMYSQEDGTGITSPQGKLHSWTLASLFL